MSACSGKVEEVVKIKDKSFSGLLMVQKVEDNTSSEEMQKIIRDKQKIEKALTMVEGLKVKETNGNKLSNTLKTQDSYSFSFVKGEKLEFGKPTMPYTFFALNDGTFYFEQKDGNSAQFRMTSVRHKKLLKELKQLLEIGF